MGTMAGVDGIDGIAVLDESSDVGENHLTSRRYGLGKVA